MLHGNNFLNDLRFITDRLSGFTGETIGFEVDKAEADNDCNGWTLSIQSYCKTEDRPLTKEEHASELMLICERLKGWTCDVSHFEVIEAVNHEYGDWDIKIRYFETEVKDSEAEDSKEA